MDDTEPRSRVQYIYDFSALDRVPDHPTSLAVTARKLLSGPTLETGKSSTVGAVLTGERIICTLGIQAAGTGAKAHSHPNEQFNYILQGTMMSDIEGDRVFASRDMILHTPGHVVHTGLACPDEDLVFLAIKDTRHGIVGPPVDGRYDGPNCFPGFGSRADEPRVSTAEVIEEWRRARSGPGKKRYVYNMSRDTDSGSGPASAEVTPDATLRLPHGITGKLLTGERLHVAVLRFEPGASMTNYRRDNEQFAFVVEGELEVEMNDEQLELRKRCILHVPRATNHELVASDRATIVLVQDKSGGEPLPS
jgi:quercetin dioxygenase-like cupin family protein